MFQLEKDPKKWAENDLTRNLALTFCEYYLSTGNLDALFDELRKDCSEEYARCWPRVHDYLFGKSKQA